MELLFLVIPTFIIFMFMFSVKSNKSLVEKAKESSKNLEESLSKMRTQIISVTGDTIPGKNIKKTIGIVRGVSDTQATGKAQFELAEKEALYKMLLEAQNMGANAIINIQLELGSYEQQGSKWQVSQAVYSGTSVVCES